MKRFKLPVRLTLACAGGLAIFWLASTSRAATETPDYTIIRTDGKFEIRDYPALTVATTPMRDGEMNSGFGQLFRFITGNNAAEEKIEMTSPVLIDTAETGKTMSFIMPRGTVEKGVPKPAGEHVTLGKREAVRMAVLRFGGERSAANEEAAIADLKGWLAAEKLVPQGDPVIAYYDPPWTPTFLRRNEVMIRLEK